MSLTDRDQGATPAPRRADPVEDLLYECLELHARSGWGAVQELLARHPEHAPRARAQLERLGMAGLLPDTLAERLPERLGHFRLLRRLGEGGMGLVFEAEDEALSRRVALKVVRPELLVFSGARERFAREVGAVARMQHPSIVPVHSVGEAEGIPYYTMELLEGGTLADVLADLRGRDGRALEGRDLIARDGSPCEASWEEACVRIVRQVADALVHAHGRGVVHRDVKPSNVALTPAGRALLFDFGLALDVRADRLTRSDTRPGSLPYMAPEQIEGGELDARTDVYALGVTLYELLTLRRAFDHPSEPALRAAVLAGDRRTPRELRPSLSRDVEVVCLKAMDRDPARRYASAEDLARDLTALLEHRPIAAREPGALLRLVRWGQRRPRTSAALAAALPLALVGSLAFGLRESRGRRAESTLRTRAERSEQRLLGLSDAKRLGLLAEAAQRSVPPRSARIGEYEAWLADADELLRRLPVHRANLAALETAAADDVARVWERESLAALLADMERVARPEVGLVAEVRARLAVARALPARSFGDPEPARRWRECLAALAADERFAALELSPLEGLLPLGPDPRSGLQEFALLTSGEAPERQADGTLPVTEDGALVLVLVPGGEFWSGSQAADPQAAGYDARSFEDERPVHRARVGPLLLSKYELTQAQWVRAGLANPSLYAPGGDVPCDGTHPVERVTWNAADAALRRIGCVLPTEAQWEWAARGGTTTPWSTGVEPESLRGAANLADVTCRDNGGPSWWSYEDWLEDGFVVHAPVGSFAPNAFGLHDVHGNVWEWCADGFDEYPAEEVDGDVARGVDLEVVVGRGGSFSVVAAEARSANRDTASREVSDDSIGVRPAMPWPRRR